MSNRSTQSPQLTLFELSAHQLTKIYPFVSFSLIVTFKINRSYPQVLPFKGSFLLGAPGWLSGVNVLSSSPQILLSLPESAKSFRLASDHFHSTICLSPIPPLSSTFTARRQTSAARRPQGESENEEDNS